jgi:hypothetical protein
MYSSAPWTSALCTWPTQRTALYVAHAENRKSAREECIEVLDLLLGAR